MRYIRGMGKTIIEIDNRINGVDELWALTADLVKAIGVVNDIRVKISSLEVSSEVTLKPLKIDVTGPEEEKELSDKILSAIFDNVSCYGGEMGGRGSAAEVICDLIGIKYNKTAHDD